LRELFAPFGQVTRVHMAMDRETGRARGFAFIEMPNDAEAAAAMTALDGKEVGGRNLKVNEARPKGEGGAPRGPRVSAAAARITAARAEARPRQGSGIEVTSLAGVIEVFRCARFLPHLALSMRFISFWRFWNVVVITSPHAECGEGPGPCRTAHHGKGKLRSAVAR